MHIRKTPFITLRGRHTVATAKAIHKNIIFINHISFFLKQEFRKQYFCKITDTRSTTFTTFESAQ